MNDKIYSTKDIYTIKELEQPNHSSFIQPKSVSSNNDIRLYRSLAKACFSPLLNNGPIKKSITEIQPGANDANNLLDKRDIINVFISEYYNYPSITKNNPDDINIKKELYESNKVFKEIMSEITSSGSLLVLVGDVGEGKSTFLQRFVVDLYNHESDFRYLPIYISVQLNNNRKDDDDKNTLTRNLWESVCSQLRKCLKTELNALNSKIYERHDKGKLREQIISALSEFKVFKDKEVDNWSLSAYISECQLVIKNVSNLIISAKAKPIIIFDNLDTICYDHERFMLFPKGFEKLRTKISIIRDIVDDVFELLNNSEISVLLTARPYVYWHVFSDKTQEMRKKISAVYELSEIEPSIPIKCRLQLLNDIIKNIKQYKIPDGKISAIENHNKSFANIIENCINHNKEPLEKFYHLSNQGFRSMIKFYNDIEYFPEIYPRYFSHNVLYLYMLGSRKMYSQILPQACIASSKVFFPNLFLVRCNNYANKEYSNACRPHKITFWLKYMILYKCYKEGKVYIDDLIDIFSDYDTHVVLLCIGSLATVNEYNCLSMEFRNESSEGIGRIEFLETTSLSVTIRGKYFIENNYCFNFECLQLYYDDFLLPFPRKEILNIECINNIYHPIDKEYSYEYLLDAIDYDEKRVEIIKIKVRQAILLSYFLECTFEIEQKIYADTWSKLEKIPKKKKNEIFDQNFFKDVRIYLITDAIRAIFPYPNPEPEQSKVLKKELDSLSNCIGESKEQIYQVFESLLTNAVI